MENDVVMDVVCDGLRVDGDGDGVGDENGDD